MDTPVFALNFEPGHEDAMGARFGEATNPPLSSCKGRRVEDKFVGFLVKDSLRLQPTHVGTVTQLRLCVRAQYAEVPGQRHPMLRLYM